MTSHTKSQIQTLLSNPAYTDEAIRILGENQTPSELRSKSTHINNDIYWDQYNHPERQTTTTLKTNCSY